MEQKIYIVLVHDNDIDTDETDIKIVTTDYDKAKKEFDKCVDKLAQDEDLEELDRDYNYVRYTNDGQEYLYEVELIERYIVE